MVQVNFVFNCAKKFAFSRTLKNTESDHIELCSTVLYWIENRENTAVFLLYPYIRYLPYSIRIYRFNRIRIYMEEKFRPVEVSNVCLILLKF